MKNRKLTQILIITVVLIFVANCKQQIQPSGDSPKNIGNNQQQSNLPSEMPNNTDFVFAFQSFVNGTKIDISIKNGTLVYKELGAGTNKSSSQPISPEQKKELYKLFVESKFDLMSFKKPDGATSEAFQTVELIIDNKQIALVKYTDIEIAPEEDISNFKKIVAKMKGFVKETK